jgi:large subunit ribosomal protein L9
LAKEKGKRSIQRIAEGKRLEKAAEAVKGAEAVLAAKANEQGHLFGSVTEKHIAANLRDQGFEVADSVVKLPEHIKQIGTHEVILRYSDEIKVPVSVVVVAESEDTLSETKEGETKEDEAKA